MVNPSSTRFQRLQAARIEEQGYLFSEVVFENTVPPCIVDSAFFAHSLSVSTTDILSTRLLEILCWKLVILAMHCTIMLEIM